MAKIIFVTVLSALRCAFLFLSEMEVRDVSEEFFNIYDVEYIDVVRLDKDGNKLPIAKR